MKLFKQLKHAWNAFRTEEVRRYTGMDNSFSYRPDRTRLSYGNEKSIVAPILNRIALDVASVNVRHVRLDENDRYTETIKSNLNDVLKIKANLDQTSKAFFLDAALSMMDEGCVALVPVDTTMDPLETGAYDIQSLRTGRILEWFPDRVRIRVYNENNGLKEDVVLPKKMVAIVENPLYSIMNEPNSVLKRLIRKLNLLDVVDEQSGSGKLDLIIQLPYIIKTETRRAQAEARKQDIENQLTGSKLGIAYIDGTEKITQLNRAVENNLLEQVTKLTTMLFSQLGLSEAVLNGTANEQEMLNYYNRTVEPLLGALVDGMDSTFITKTARTQGQAIKYFRDPFKFTTIADLADLADKFTRNEIFSSNDIRAIVGFQPSKQAGADELRNKNMPVVDDKPIEGEKKNEKKQKV